MCFRLKVVNEGVYPALGCEGYLTEVYFEGERPELAPMNLIWVSQPPLMSVDIKAPIERYLDVLVIGENGDVGIRSHGWPPNNKRDFFKRTGNYIFEVVVSPHNGASTPPFCFSLAYDGNWKTSQIKVM
jgi:hypothetical protein